ncbi:MAG: twin-arginine translocase TatA/TatE family subunit [Phycisphaeraceae bacterium]|nr:twin-arginine translocase TatA/TatE family subunit [Phycisphaeraceae bacterium]
MPIAAILQVPASLIGLIGPFGPWEIGAILVIAVLLFGRRLPDVGRNVGKAIIEFKRGVKGITDEIEEETRKPEAGTRGDRPPATPELDAPRGTAYRDSAFHEEPAGDAGRPDANPRTN